ncbi:glycosyltransferase [Aureimonas sp. AU40]|uniref:glycosyltransferase n=1 Tax=Aureimonas sp. AU40 TaxID=1637747 RepID=UPI00078406C3|nr:glycosyltransferase [Aureimonas sp. AU40]
MHEIQQVEPFRLDVLEDHETISRVALHRGGAFSMAGAVACLPARDEAERIEATLRALLAELGIGEGVVLVVNGSADDTAAQALRVLQAGAAPFLLLDIDWRAGHGSAPLARRLALDCADQLAPGAHLFSLDADTETRPGWRAAYEAEFAGGAALVCGAIGFDPAEAALLPPTDEAAETVLREYRAAAREIDARLDPDPINPWPHHGNIGGANFGLRAGVYAALGGLPVTPFGEDRALLRRARALGLPVRFSEGPVVWTSCRFDGRARGGLSDELKRSRSESDPLVDEALEPAPALERRIRARLAYLKSGDVGARALVVAGLGVEPDAVEAAFQAGSPGEAWLLVEAQSPELSLTRLRRSQLAAELPALLRLLNRVRESAGDPSDSARSAPHAPA